MATPEEEARRQEEARRRAAAAAVAGGTLVTVGDPSVAPAAGVPTTAARAAAAGTILSSLVAYLAVQRARQRAWLMEQMRRRQSNVSPDDIERLLDEEQERQATFETKQAERFSRDLTTALAIPDAAQREGAIRGIVNREERYTRQREIAMAARAFAALDRVALRQESPQGAFWKLDPTVIEHTAGCLIMGGKFWPWAVLDRVHPPRHAGCPCRLVGYGQAIAQGLMSPGAVRDVQTAIRAAASVVMEGVQLDLDPADAQALVEMGERAESEALREALVAQGLATEESLDALAEFDPDQPRDRFGRWIDILTATELAPALTRVAGGDYEAAGGRVVVQKLPGVNPPAWNAELRDPDPDVPDELVVDGAASLKDAKGLLDEFWKKFPVQAKTHEDTPQQKAILRQSATARKVRRMYPAGTRVEGTSGAGGEGRGGYGTVRRHVPMTNAQGGTLTVEWDSGHVGRVSPGSVRKVEEAEVEEAFNPEQARWPKGHPRAGQWRPKVGGVVGGPTAEMFETEVAALRKMAAPRKIGRTSSGGGPEEDLFERAKPQHEVEAIGTKVAELAERYSTVGAYQQRIEALAAERTAISDTFWKRVGDLDGYQEKYDELKKQGVEDAVAEMNLRYYTDAERARQKAINEEVVSLSHAKERATRDAIVGILSQIRPMGGKPKVRAIEHDADWWDLTPEQTRDAFAATLAEVSRLIPTAWWDDVNAKGAITFRASNKRAWHLSDKDGDGSTIRVHPERPQTVLHELAHRFEAHYGEPNAAGFMPLLGPTAKFRESRLKPGERTEALRELRPGHGYEGHERAFEDEFADPYMGKVYVGDRATEILTMGMERVFYPPYGTAPTIDDAMRSFILGLMATV